MDPVLDDTKTTKHLVGNNRSGSDLDEPDKLPSDLSISNWDVIALTLAIISHIIDVCIDFNVAYQYFKSGKLIYFWLTVMFIAVPSIINTYMSLKMSVDRLDIRSFY